MKINIHNHRLHKDLNGKANDKLLTCGMEQTFKKTVKLLFLLLIALMVFASCGNSSKKKATSWYYLLDKNNSQLVRVDYEFKGENTKERIEEVLSIYDNYKGSDYVSPMPDGVEREGWKVEKGNMSVFFNNAYLNLAVSDEVLIRAAIVKTMCQFTEINYVSFFVNDKELSIKGRTIGMMNSDSFLDDINLTEGTMTLALYFPLNGTQLLKEEAREVVFNTMYTDEQLVIEELMKGSQLNSTICSSGIPDNTRLLSVVTKDMVCYVNFSKEFLEQKSGITPQQTVYSIVNSLCRIPGISSVTLMVEGRDIDHYGSFGVNNQITINYNIVEGYTPEEE